MMVGRGNPSAGLLPIRLVATIEAMEATMSRESRYDTFLIIFVSGWGNSVVADRMVVLD